MVALVGSPLVKQVAKLALTKAKGPGVALVKGSLASPPVGKDLRITRLYGGRLEHKKATALNRSSLVGAECHAMAIALASSIHSRWAEQRRKPKPQTLEKQLGTHRNPKPRKTMHMKKAQAIGIGMHDKGSIHGQYRRAKAQSIGLCRHDRGTSHGQYRRAKAS